MEVKASGKSRFAKKFLACACEFHYDEAGRTIRGPQEAGFFTGRLSMFVDEPTLQSRLTRSACALAALMVWASFDVGSASASCGDYVMVGGHEHSSGDHSMPGVPACHGPNCQKQVPLPVLPSKGLPNSPPTDMACWSVCRSSAEPSLVSAVFEWQVLLVEGHSLPLLRPPCL